MNGDGLSRRQNHTAAVRGGVLQHQPAVTKRCTARAAWEIRDAMDRVVMRTCNQHRDRALHDLRLAERLPSEKVNRGFGLHPAGF